MREFAEGERIPLCPLPYDSVEGHITRLVARGYKVAIAEQIGDPRTAKRLIEREVVRVVTLASAMAARRHPPSGCDSGPVGAEPDRSGRPRLQAALYTFASATVSVTAPNPHG